MTALWLLSCSGLLIVLAEPLLAALRNIPEGYEDERGFHCGPDAHRQIC